MIRVNVSILEIPDHFGDFQHVSLISWRGGIQGLPDLQHYAEAHHGIVKAQWRPAQWISDFTSEDWYGCVSGQVEDGNFFWPRLRLFELPFAMQHIAPGWAEQLCSGRGGRHRKDVRTKMRTSFCWPFISYLYPFISFYHFLSARHHPVYCLGPPAQWQVVASPRSPLSPSGTPGAGTAERQVMHPTLPVCFARVLLLLCTLLKSCL